jgi:hypothetical protein
MHLENGHLHRRGLAFWHLHLHGNDELFPALFTGRMTIEQMSSRKIM